MIGELPRTDNLSVSTNPDLLVYDYKLRDLSLEQRLKQQKLLPKLSFKYEALANGFDFTPANETDFGIGDFVLQDNKWGSKFFHADSSSAPPVADVQLNTIKQERTQLQRTQKNGELELKLAQYNEQIRQISEQLVIYRQIVNDYESLLEAERTKFRFGESSVFLLNSRENKLLDARLKLVKLESELAKAITRPGLRSRNLITW